MARIGVIGSGFSGISAAAYLAAAGHEVHVYEKNSAIGGRARQLKTDNGYMFDMGPSWYWMPGVFEKFFQDFGCKVSDFYALKLLDPSFDVVFGEKDTMHVPENFEQLCALFESIETGSAEKLKLFMQEAEYKYQTGIDNLVYKPGLSLTEFADMLRDEPSKLEAFTPLANIGHTAEEMVQICNHLQQTKSEIQTKNLIISGGVQHFLDAYYLMSLNSMPSLYGMASAFLKHAMGEYDALKIFFEQQISGLNMCRSFLKIKNHS